jgi:hypothetical protein
LLVGGQWSRTVALYREKFEKDSGYRFYRRNKSILIQLMSYGRRLSPADMTNLVRGFREYKDAIDGRTAHPYGSNNIVSIPTLANFPDITDPTYYKYISEETWNYILNEHSFKLGTAAEYRSTTNLGMKDEQEGI